MVCGGQVVLGVFPYVRSPNQQKAVVKGVGMVGTSLLRKSPRGPEDRLWDHVPWIGTGKMDGRATPRFEDGNCPLLPDHQCVAQWVIPYMGHQISDGTAHAIQHHGLP